MFKKFIIGTIKIYQRTISPDHGYLKSLRPNGFCRFYPSCSQYMIDAVEEHGCVKGIALGSWRIMRCNPFSRGGYDAVPKCKKHFLKK
ncbi:membrane protein insertion efficiency factor YidD [Candidatus Berkelbacteria bacterium CG10_big_fil_rev_8_21_14_0_10_41_12]|uniref:Putative membrane protein insertion efficiency factor n=1 Tax=Candidatus Berkelbacteria bacterium CG10_big_fil_rev_8_21_14_0_10_41_12 TaxID=1974513 RepID=A0A2M6WXL2_9BACT|nr:MAG: membrane protein insertion efficiency factor YidD [Candidatus Berkelbacteria bacterium CG10_big_fil_rev_8_21_14_0_10_41_12]